MKYFNLIILLAIGSSNTACGQNTAKKKQTSTLTSKKQQTMDLSKITDSQVKQAIEALQMGDKNWYSFFIKNPAMTDDGNKVDFKAFFANALGKEMFLSIDRVENDSKNIHGNFKAGQWGTFPVFFRFHKNTEGKFDRLDIGQDK
ncbi:hypothetical protein [Chryseobacterium sp. Marseille-Q3244]|uniref:hypothetical protein n=1 Tax=Chryseobacterium sp. Marseille-Q3244 TaxID=2758092 RepID=UPI002024157F|nr:hypothetical protein [Chryseobacterium sp. Marseille-Q3244]